MSHPMRGLALLLALTASLAHAAPARTVAPAAGSAAAVALLDSVAARVGALQRFDLCGQMSAAISGGTMNGQHVDIPLRFAAIRPGRLHNEMRNPNLTTVFISDGDSLFTGTPNLRQFTMQPAPMLQSGNAAADGWMRQLDPLLTYAKRPPGTPPPPVREAGRDTVMTDAGPVTCRRIAFIVPSDTTSDAPQRMLGRMLWIDESRRMVLRDSMALAVQHPQLGSLTTTQQTRFTHIDLASGGPDTLYRITKPEGWSRVTRIGAPDLDPDSRAGQPAKDFRLETLDGAVVTLASLKGKVVVLDFWATWCGPCQEEAPTIRDLAKEYGSKGVTFWAVNRDDGDTAVEATRAFVQQRHLEGFPAVFAGDALGAAYKVQFLPTLYVIGKDGKVRFARTGLVKESRLRQELDQALAAP